MLNDLFSHLYCIYLLWESIDKNRLVENSELAVFPFMHLNKTYKLNTSPSQLFLAIVCLTFS